MPAYIKILPRRQLNGGSHAALHVEQVAEQEPRIEDARS